jgi:hypothetical protein
MSGEIRSEERGFHWVAWVASDGQPERPAGSVLMVGLTKEEAEARARALLAAEKRPAN